MENQEYIGSGWDVGFTGNDIWHILRRKETSVAMHKQLEDYIKENLEGETRKTALDFVEYLNVKRLTFYKDTCDYWKDKIYYWVKYEEQCVCFIAIANPDEPENLWTVWSDDSKVYEYDRHSKRQKRSKKEIGIHSIRGGTIVGEHDVIFAGHDEVITISHSAYSKEVFAVGSVRAAKFIANKPAGLYDMNSILSFE